MPNMDINSNGIVIKGLDKVSEDFKSFGKDIEPGLETIARDAIIYVHSNIPSYPPQRPTWYRRTMTLWRSITTFQGQNKGAISRVDKLFGEVAAYVGSSVEYAPEVIDEDNQAETFVGYWWTLQEVIRGLKPGIREVFNKGMKNMIAKHFK